ncbi:MAG: AraC family transcriptional regulator [Candidatus Pelethousia sp.]|nr:AraC family transcriptional regulator [Candidatus Pelethousia sp.]
MEESAKRGYLHEDFRLFHIRDQIELELSYHYHEFNKVVIFLSGNVTYVVEGKAYFLQPWDILLVPHGQIHRPIIDPSEPYERIILWMNTDYLLSHSAEDGNLLQCFHLAQERKFALIRLDASLRPELRRMLSVLEDALHSTEFAHTLLAKASFLQLVVAFNRMALRDATSLNPETYRSDPKVEEILSYINENLDTDLSLDAMASRFYISKSYLMHRFKELTGCSAHKYVRQKRLLWAAEMIRDGIPVIEAGQRCGFRDYSAFLRAFKQVFGITPSEIG